MSDIGKTMVCIVGSVLFCAGAGAIGADSANPYQGIVDRNVFGLKPLPPPKASGPEKPPAPKITLNGITTILHKKQVFMTAQLPARPPEPAKPQSFILSEGQRDGDIEVLEIDEKTGTVKLNNFGVAMTLTMDKDGAKLPASAPGPMLASAVPNQSPYAPQPAAGNP